MEQAARPVTIAPERMEAIHLAVRTTANAAKPFIGFAGNWTTVLGIRFADRIGKGLRTSPRDALIADVTQPDQRGAAFGLRQAMDHAGAVAGPLIAAGLLWLGVSMRNVFIASVIPGMIVMIVLLVWVKERPRKVAANPRSLGLVHGWSRLGGNFRRLILAIVVFTLGNSAAAR